MVGMAFAALLAIRSVAHSGEVVYLEDIRAIVWVKSCSGEYVSLYYDEEMKVPMANPLYADKKGRYSYFTPSPYGEVTVDWGGKPIVMRNCPVPKPDTQ